MDLSCVDADNAFQPVRIERACRLPIAFRRFRGLRGDDIGRRDERQRRNPRSHLAAQGIIRRQTVMKGFEDRGVRACAEQRPSLVDAEHLGRRRRHRRLEIELLAGRVGAVDERALAPAGRLQHVGGDEVKESPHLQPWLLQPMGESRCKRTMIAHAVLGHLPRRRGINDQDSCRRLGGRKSALHGARRDRPPHRHDEGILAASIENDKTQLFRVGDGIKHPVERDRFIGNIAVVVEHDVSRQQVVDAADLHPVAGVIDERPVRLIGRGAEGSERGEHSGARDVLDPRDLEAVDFEGRGDEVGVARRIGQRRFAAIGGIADDEGDPAIGGSRDRQAKP